MTKPHSPSCDPVFFDRLERIKAEYRHFHHIPKMCHLLGQMAGELTGAYMDTEPEDPRTMAYCPREPNPAYSQAINDWLVLLETTRLSLSHLPDVLWVCKLTARLIKGPIEVMALRVKLMDGYLPDIIADPKIAELVSNVQAVLVNFAHDDDVVAICRFLDENLPNLYFPDGSDTAVWRPQAVPAEDGWRTGQALDKVEHAFYFLSQVEEEFTVNPQISWICELARTVIDRLPAIGDSLDCFADGPYVDNWEEDFDDATA